MPVNSHVSDVNPVDGRAAIHRVKEAGDHVTIVMALIEADKSCVNIQDSLGLSPLHMACKLARRKIAIKLSVSSALAILSSDWLVVVNCLYVVNCD